MTSITISPPILALSNDFVKMTKSFSQGIFVKTISDSLVCITDKKIQRMHLLTPQRASTQHRDVFDRKREPFEKIAQDLIMRAHLMSNGVIGSTLGAVLYLWLTRRGIASVLSDVLALCVVLFASCVVIKPATSNAITIAAQPARTIQRVKIISSILSTFTQGQYWLTTQKKSMSLSRYFLRRFPAIGRP